MDESLAKGLSSRWVKELTERESYTRKAITLELLRFDSSTKGAKKCINSILSQMADDFIDHQVIQDGAGLRILHAHTTQLPNDPSDTAFSVETLDILPKKRKISPIGIRIRFSIHSLRRAMQRIGWREPVTSDFSYAPLHDAIKDANLWAQTMLNAMRFGKLLIQDSQNVNILVPTRYGAFAGAFNDTMTCIDVRSFLGFHQLLARDELVLKCWEMMRDHEVDLNWISDKNFKDPKVIGAFIMAEQMGIFSVNWNKTSEQKDTKLNLDIASSKLMTKVATGEPVHTNKSLTDWLQS